MLLTTPLDSLMRGAGGPMVSRGFQGCSYAVDLSHLSQGTLGAASSCLVAPRASLSAMPCHTSRIALALTSGAGKTRQGAKPRVRICERKKVGLGYDPKRTSVGLAQIAFPTVDYG